MHNPTAECRSHAHPGDIKTHAVMTHHWNVVHAVGKVRAYQDQGKIWLIKAFVFVQGL